MPRGDDLRLRVGTTDAWEDLNPVLLLGEPGYDFEARVLKVGDGVTAWLDLDGISGGGSVDLSGLVKTTDGGEYAYQSQTISGAHTLSLSNGSFLRRVLTGDVTVTFPTVPAGTGAAFVLWWEQDGTGGWDTTIAGTNTELLGWAVGDLDTAAGAKNLITGVNDPSTGGKWHLTLANGPFPSLDDLTDVTVTAAASGQIVEHNGTAFVNVKPREVIGVACSDETTAITAGTAKATFRMPFAMTLTSVRATLTTASTAGGPFTVDINDGGTTILSTKLTIDDNEKTSTTAATAAVISDTALADDAEITVDVDDEGTGAKGLKVYLIGRRT